MTIENGIDFSRLPQPVLPAHPEWRQLWEFAWREAARHVRVSRGRRHMDVGWDPACNYQWVWDTCFMALYARYAADQYPGVESLDNFYELQREDGLIAMTYDMTTGEMPYGAPEPAAFRLGRVGALPRHGRRLAPAARGRADREADGVDRPEPAE